MISEGLIKMLEEQYIPGNQHELLDIANIEFNKASSNVSGLLFTAIDCYNYGIIIGKRQERAKHKVILNR